jgi:hypothetical protein
MRRRQLRGFNLISLKGNFSHFNLAFQTSQDDGDGATVIQQKNHLVLCDPNAFETSNFSSLNVSVMWINVALCCVGTGGCVPLRLPPPFPFLLPNALPKFPTLNKVTN